MKLSEVLPTWLLCESRVSAGANLLKKSGPLSGHSVQGDWAGEVVLYHSREGVKSLATQLPPLPSLEVAPFSTVAVSTDFLTP